MQAPGGIDDQDVLLLRPSPAQGPLGDIDRAAFGPLRVDRYAGLRPEALELVDRGGALGVARGDRHRLTLVLELKRELRRCRRLARALQPGHQDHRRSLRGEDQIPPGAAHQLGELLVDHLDHHLARIEALEHPGADGLLTDAGDEVLRDLEVDVGLEQREADLPHRLVDVGLAQLATRAQVGHRALEAI